jgi:predicted ferric reductase
MAGLSGVGLGVAIALVITTESWSQLASPGGLMVALGRLCAMTGSYLMLIMVVLMARVPWLERVVGQDRLVRWHRRIGGWPIGLITLHIVFITVGYSHTTGVGPLAQFWVFLKNYPDMLAATVGFGLLVTAGVTSFRFARRHMKYETWWVIHFYIYLALMLAFVHQIQTGVMFLGHPLVRIFWIGLWAGGAAVVIASRILLPIARNFKHQLRVAAVQEEAPGVYSLTISGRRLSTLNVAGGQFFQWRFLQKNLWWHPHPYSLSALPRPPYLRVTIKALGDQSSAVARLTPGTRVFVEGPYGAFTRHVRRSEKVALIGAGVGITPLRALLEDLPMNVRVTAVVRASKVEDLVHHEEMQTLVDQHQGRLHEIIGSRKETPLDANVLRRLIPDVAQCDVYLCGPSGFTDQIAAALSRLSVNPDRIHIEEFAF